MMTGMTIATCTLRIDGICLLPSTSCRVFFATWLATLRRFQVGQELQGFIVLDKVA